MVSPEQPQNLPATKHTTTIRTKHTRFISDSVLVTTGALSAIVVLWGFWSFFTPNPMQTFSLSTLLPVTEQTCAGPDLLSDPVEPNFYDDPELSYTIDGKPMENWDEKRKEWLKQHPSFAAGVESRVLMVTGSQAAPCKNPIGDYLLLKFFKNKVDYCRRHGMDIFYNNVLLQPKMFSFWAKTPTVKAAMLAHPEVEWIWWVDSDAAITDMDFKLPLDRYKAHNMVVHGWPGLVSWTSINAGVFLIRNNQWAMDFMDTWAGMGPQSSDYDKWGEILSATFKDKIFPQADDQSGLIYLTLKEKEKWGDKIYIEGEYYFEGYWAEIADTLDNITNKYVEIEKETPELRRRHAEKVSESLGTKWEEHLKDVGIGKGSLRRPFITHFTGCQPCSGDHNQVYSGNTCFDTMQKALLFADNQVLRSYGFVHLDLLDPATVDPLPYNYPASAFT